MGRDALWDRYENAKIDRAKAEIDHLKKRRAAELAEEALFKATAAEGTAADAWRKSLGRQTGKSDEEDGA